jgi:FkbM family methyltransferase
MDEPRARDISWRRFLAQSVKARTARACSFALRYKRPRMALNWLYENGGPLVQNPFDRFCSAAVPTVKFEWWTSVGGREFRLPVEPETPRSWNTALAWSWSGNRAIRRLYERYLSRRPNGVLFDIGGNDGTHTYPFAAHGYRCVTFEPQPTCVAYIEETCALNGFSNVTTVCAVVTDEAESEVELWVSPSTWISSRIREHTERFETATPVRVAAVRLDQVAAELGLFPSMIKIDVEGWEWHVVRGAQELLGKHRPDMLVEIQGANPDKPEIWRLMNGLGYSCTRIVHESAHPLERIHSIEAFLNTAGRYGDDYFFGGESSVDWLR